uniref:Uncharacterized protein n=1 Tax=Micrurus spixii TaxID=129469 RepID=A0A2D4NI94_9SAUR
MITHAPPTPFNPASENWDSYIVRFKFFLEANDLLELSDNRKRVLFLSYCGSDIFETAKALMAPAAMQTVPWTMLQSTLRTHYVSILSKIVRGRLSADVMTRPETANRSLHSCAGFSSFVGSGQS